MVDSLEAGRLVLFPQLLLTTVAMLPVTYIHIFMLIMDLFSKVSLQHAFLLDLISLLATHHTFSGLLCCCLEMGRADKQNFDVAGMCCRF